MSIANYLNELSYLHKQLSFADCDINPWHTIFQNINETGFKGLTIPFNKPQRKK